MDRTVSRIIRITLITAGLVLGSYQQAFAAATITVTPSHGVATARFTATYRYVLQPQEQCPGSTAEFRWDGYQGPGNVTGSEGTHLGSAPLNGNCQAVLSNVRPPGNPAPGNHKVWAFVDNGQGMPVAQATVTDSAASYKVDTRPSPTPKPTHSRTPTAQPTASPKETRSPSPTPTPSNSRSAIPEPTISGSPLPAALRPGAPLPPIGGGFKTGPFIPFAAGGLAAIAAAGLAGAGKLLPGVTGGARAGVAGVGFVVGLALIGGGAIVSGADKVIEINPLGLGLEVREASVSVAVARTAAVEAHCPSGKLPVSGGFTTDWSNEKTGPSAPPFGPKTRWGGPVDYYNNQDIDTNHTIGPQIRRNEATADGWAAEIFNSTVDLGPVTLTARVLCANGTTADTPAVGAPLGVTRWATARSETTTGTVARAIVDCPPGRIATGGSYLVGNGAVTQFLPFDIRTDSWEANYQSLPGRSGSAEGGVVCAAGTAASGDVALKAPKGSLLWRLVSGPTQRVPVATIGVARATCPSGSKVTGGGYSVRRYLTDLLQYTIVLESGPDGDAWQTKIYAARVLHTDSQITPFAICITQKKS